MKTRTAFRALPLASTLFFFTTGSAQQLSFHTMQSSNTETGGTYARSITTVDKLLPAEIANNTEKAYRNFEHQFKSATEIKKSTVATGAIIYCKIDDIKHELYYDRKGNLSHIVRYFDESKLIPSVREIVLEKYNGYDIFGVIEITVKDQKVYHLKMQSRSTWKTVQVNGDTMTETESYKI